MTTEATAAQTATAAKIARAMEARIEDVDAVECHRSTTAHGRYRYYGYQAGNLVITGLVGLQSSGDVTTEYGQVLGTIKL